MNFNYRHIGKYKKIMNKLNINSLNNFISKTNVLHNFKKQNIPNLSEYEAQDKLKKIINKNKDHKSFLGMGYYNTKTPAFIKRHIIENPHWYTAYTPYQAEISQGRLESQYNYQTVIKELTDMPVSNGSLLDDASATGEAINLSYAYYKEKRNTILVCDNIHPHILDVVKTRAKVLNLSLVKLEEANIEELKSDKICNIIFQYPNTYGEIDIPFEYIKYAHKHNILTTSITDLLALTHLITPGELGVDITVGNCQRFGIPLWYGGPHPAFFATSNKLLRYIPGRIINKSIDVNNDPAFRLALQTREQHIRKNKATSNICTSQSLLTNVVSFYTIYNGKYGLKNKAKTIKDKINYFVKNIQSSKIVNKTSFDTITLSNHNTDNIFDSLDKKNYVIRKIDNNKFSVTFDELTTYDDIDLLVNEINKFPDKNSVVENYNTEYSTSILRQSEFLTDDIFNKYTTETDIVRYINHLTSKDYTLCNGMIPLGSCTMKLNASYQLEPLLWDKVCNVHPFVPLDYARGYQELIKETGEYLKKITGCKHYSFQPNSGATGEYTGLLAIKQYHNEMGDDDRNICMIPKSAHGTNFASAAIAKYNIETFDDKYFENLDNFEEYLKKFNDKIACMMITYPNTNGVFQKNIKDIVSLVHKYGGLVYMDGANMNALVGICSPGDIGFDVCHLNLHKTFCIPHGGGGPGLGPIFCNDLLAPYLPSNILQTPELNKYNQKYSGILDNYDYSRYAVASSNWSSASLLTIPYLYISAMGIEGLTEASKVAILNANYLKNELKNDYTIIDVNENEMVGHEFIIDVREFKHLNITETDIAKRLMDYSFHPPTMSWPRSSVLMFEPTESESIEELDRLVIALKSIRNEIKDIENKKYDTKNNLLKNSPHNFRMTTDWQYPYSIKEAFYPVDSLYDNKFNIPVGRINDVYGDKQLLSNK
uniref:glycine dehydrogenase (aminomethyl-transferring) n=1 Tax=Megaviridae environmental sample TaxID=1737588 RepID=A0A5J6VLX3_9VIRU|nr:MAG: glycine cleavage system P-protein [Megaviridae environmental sample]